MAIIYHITKAELWQSSQTRGCYRGDTLEGEGFIHCSLGCQLIDTANRFFAGEDGLVILGIDANRVDAEIRFEGLPGGDKFPHIYGPLNLNAVTAIIPLTPEADGRFALPPGLDQA